MTREALLFLCIRIVSLAFLRSLLLCGYFLCLTIKMLLPKAIIITKSIYLVPYSLFQFNHIICCLFGSLTCKLFQHEACAVMGQIPGSKILDFCLLIYM